MTAASLLRRGEYQTGLGEYTLNVEVNANLKISASQINVVAPDHPYR